MPRIVTIDELRIYLDHEGYEERANPTLLSRSIDSAERWVENYTGRSFAPNPPLENGADTADPVEKSFRVTGRGWIRIPDLRVAESVDLDGVLLEEDVDYELDTFNAGDEPHTSIKILTLAAISDPLSLSTVARLNIVGRWGFHPAPDDVKDSILALAARQYRRRDAMFSDVIDQGNVSFEYTKGVPNFITEIVDLYKLPRIGIV